MNSYKPCLKHHPQEVHPFQAKYYSSQKSLLVCNCTWIYIWAVHESLSKYGTFICFPGGHTELGNNLLWADALLKYNTVLENTPHRLDRKYRKVSSAATWVCFIQFNSDLIFFSFTTSLRAVQPWKPCHLTLLQTQHMALQVLSWPSISKAAHPLLLAQTLAASIPVSIDPSESWACSKCVVFPPTPPFFFSLFSAGSVGWFVLWREQTSTRAVKVRAKQSDAAEWEQGRRKDTKEIPPQGQRTVPLTKLS